MNEKKWSLNSAVYHAVDGMLFQNNNLFFKVKTLWKGSAQRTDSILNEPQLKRFLYNKIKKLHNQRIIDYSISNSFGLKDDGEDMLDIKLYQPVEKDIESGEYKDESGRFTLYPRSFYCSVCNDFVIINNYDSSKRVYSNKCQNKGCAGYYKQIPMVKFCSQCGKIDEIYYQCKCKEAENIRKSGKKAPLKFKWDRWDDPKTWRFECEFCRNKEDFLKLPCFHNELEKGEFKTICSKKPLKYSPMSLLAGQGGGPKPIVVTMIDIPPMKVLKHPKREKVLCAVISGKLNFLQERAEKMKKSIVELVDSNYANHSDKINKENVIGGLATLYPEKSLKELEAEFDKMYSIPAIDKALDEVSSSLPSEEMLAEIINFHSLKGTFSSELNSFSYKSKVMEEKNEEKLSEVKKIFNEHKIEDIYYLANLKVISSCIGTVNGKTHAEGTEKFTPHFSPFWTNDKKKIYTYCNPYNTEGLLVEFNKSKVLDWIENSTGVKLNLTPEEFFMNLKESDEHYQLIYKLLHTISHLLIKKSEVFTGIDSQSCGEMILPTNASILIYSTSTINIGGFNSLFEQGLLPFITESDFEMRKCIYDPLCLIKEGSCFSCMHLPEHVCCNFNNLLDRDVLIGSGIRHKECFW